MRLTHSANMGLSASGKNQLQENLYIMTDAYLLTAHCLILILNILLVISVRRALQRPDSNKYGPPTEGVTLKLSQLEREQTQSLKAIEELPTKILRTIQGSVNSTTGKLGELVKFIELQRMYDRLIPVGSIVDFIGVSFPTDQDPGTVSFIDVKTGKRAALSKDQRELKKLVEAGLISFNVVKVEVE